MKVDTRVLRRMIDQEKRRRLSRAESHRVIDHNTMVQQGKASNGAWLSKYPQELKDAVVQDCLQGEVKMVAAQYGVPRTTVNEWVRMAKVPREA